MKLNDISVYWQLCHDYQFGFTKVSLVIRVSLPEGHLRQAGWVWSSSWVWVGVWCDAPASGAPQTAARPHRQAVCPVEGGGGLPGRLTLCPMAVQEEEEGPQRGWEPPPEPCPGRTPSLLVK